MTALVGADGRVDEFDAPDGARFLRTNAVLIRYAAGFLDSGSPGTHFFWQDPARRWMSVRMDPAPVTLAGAARVLVTMTPATLPHGLTPREMDVLTLMAGGLSNQEIADRLVTSARTVSTHVEHILAKLSQASRAGAAAVAVDGGCLRLPIPGRGPAPEGLTVGFLHARACGDPRRARSTGSSARRGLLQRPLLIGSAFPLSGSAAHDGREMLNGSALAVTEVNARGGIGGRPVEQIVVDTDIFTVEGVEHAFERLFAAGVDAITSGYVFMEDVAREVASRYGAPYLHAMTSESQAQIVRDNHAQHSRVFQVCPTELHYGLGFLRFLDDLRGAGRWHPPNRRLVFIETTLPSGQMVNQLTVAAAERSGWEIAAIDTVPTLDADWSRVVDRIERLDPAAVMITQFLASELAGFQRQVAQRAPHVLVYAIYAPSVPEFLHLAGTAAEGLVWATVTGTYSDLVAQRFGEDYAQAFGLPPGRSHAGIAYDEVHLLAQAWASVPNPSHFQSVADQLRRLRYRGVNGAYCLDNAGQSGLGFPDVTRDPSLGQAHLVFQVQNGRHRIIAPAPYAEASFQPPRGMQAVAGQPAFLRMRA